MRQTKSVFSLILALVLCVTFISGCGKANNSAEQAKKDSVVVPKLVGLNYITVTESDEYSDYTFDIIYEESDSIAKDIIISQSLPAGRKIKPSQTIRLTVSLGYTGIKVPQLTDMNSVDAQNALKEAGLEFSVFYEAHDSVKKDVVFATFPEKDTFVAEKEVVTLYVSAGKKNTYLTETEKSKLNLVNMNVTDAKKLLSSFYLNAKLNYQNSDLPKGTVVKATLPLKKLAKGDSVSLTISTGNSDGMAKSVTVPSLSGIGVDEVALILTNLGLSHSVIYQQSSTVESGYIISTSPSATEQVSVGTEIILFVSKGIE